MKRLMFMAIAVVALVLGAVSLETATGQTPTASACDPMYQTCWTDYNGDTVGGYYTETWIVYRFYDPYTGQTFDHWVLEYRWVCC